MLMLMLIQIKKIKVIYLISIKRDKNQINNRNKINNKIKLNNNKYKIIKIKYNNKIKTNN